jgi:hypothetical protein
VLPDPFCPVRPFRPPIRPQIQFCSDQNVQYHRTRHGNLFLIHAIFSGFVQAIEYGGGDNGSFRSSTERIARARKPLGNGGLSIFVLHGRSRSTRYLCKNQAKGNRMSALTMLQQPASIDLVVMFRSSGRRTLLVRPGS